MVTPEQNDDVDDDDHDEAVNIPQRNLTQENIRSSPFRKGDIRIELIGEHDQIWREGEKETHLTIAAAEQFVEFLIGIDKG